MRYYILLFTSFCPFIFSQNKEVDTLYYKNQKSKYDSIAKSYVQKMIESNKVYLKTLDRNDKSYNQIFVGNLEELELIIHPIYQFKKNIVENDGSQNLMKYINFVNNPYYQDIDIYLKKEKKWIWGFRITENEYTKIMNPKNIKEYFGKLFIPIREINNFDTPNYYYLFKDNFSFYINDDYCFLLDGKLFSVENVDLPEKYLKIQEFNYHFLPQLNYIKLKAQGRENESFSEYIIKKEIKEVFLKVVEK